MVDLLDNDTERQTRRLTRHVIVTIARVGAAAALLLAGLVATYVATAHPG